MASLDAEFALPETNDWYEGLLDACSQKHRHYQTEAHVDHFLRDLAAAIAALQGE